MNDSSKTAGRQEPWTRHKPLTISIAIGLILFFVAIGFPWNSVARRVAWEVSSVSGALTTIESMAPAITARGPVLRATDVVIEHPATGRVRLSQLEIAPRSLGRWLSGVPTLRIWTETELGLIDGVLGLGDSPSFIGPIRQVDLARLPLRLDATGIRLAGRLDGEVDITLDPNGTLRGRMEFESDSLVIRSDRLPIALPFSRAEGIIVLLESGATQIESMSVEGEVIEGHLSGEIGLVHHSQSPPIDLNVQLRIVDPRLRQIAPSAGFPLTANGELNVHVLGTVDAPVIETGKKVAAARKRKEARAKRRQSTAERNVE